MSIPLTLAVGMCALLPSVSCQSAVRRGCRDVAGGRVAGAERGHRRVVRGAPLDRHGASGPEPAAGRRRDRAGDLALQAAAGELPLGVGVGDRVEQRLRVGVPRVAEHGRRSGRSRRSCPRYITAVRWLMCSTTARSCATNTIARPRSRWRSASRFRTCACTETSSAETGSSATISFGRRRERRRDADALALAARELVRAPVGERRIEPDARRAGPAHARRRSVLRADRERVERLARRSCRRATGGRSS